MKDGIIKKEYKLIKKEYALIKKELRLLLNFKYPKSVGLILIILSSYFIFTNPSVLNYVNTLNEWGYLGVFIAGIFFSFGFTSPLSVGFFITLNPDNILLAGILGGIGAMCGDLIIFKMIKFSFLDEFKRLENTVTIRKVSKLIDKTIIHKIKVYLIYLMAGIFIASPLPNEIAIVMLAGLTKIKPSILAPISLIMNTIGITILLFI